MATLWAGKCCFNGEKGRKPLHQLRLSSSFWNLIKVYTSKQMTVCSRQHCKIFVCICVCLCFASVLVYASECVCVSHGHRTSAEPKRLAEILLKKTHTTPSRGKVFSGKNVSHSVGIEINKSFNGGGSKKI